MRAGMVYVGDCVEVMASWPEGCVDAIVTDPPYHLTAMTKRFGKEGSAPAKGPAYRRHNTGFMGQAWDGGDVAFRPETWASALRVLKPGGHLAAFGGTRTFHRLACAIEDAGFEIRDTLCWLYGSGFPKSLDVSKAIDKAAGAKREVVGTGLCGGTGASYNGPSAGRSRDFLKGEFDITEPATDDAHRWQGWGTALKPAYEPIVLARKPLSERNVAANVLKHGTGAVNVAACRIHTEGSEAKDYTVTRLKPGATLNKTGGNWRPENDGVDYQGRTKAGRWPANVILDAEAAALLDEQSGMRRGASHTAGSGSRPTAPSLTDTKSTTETTTRSTTPSKTSNSSAPSGTTTTTNESGRTIGSSTESSIDGASSVAGTDRWQTSLPVEPEPGKAIAATAPARTCASGGGATGSTPTPTCAPITRVGEPSATRRYTERGSTDLSPLPGERREVAAAPSRFFYTAKADSAERSAGLGQRNTHPTVKPVDLMVWLVKLVTPPGGVVLDPFLGSGSTALAAQGAGFQWVGIELSPEYAAIAMQRIGMFARLAE